MKGKFFYFALSALALTACTSEDVVEDAVASRNVIGFENVVNKITRAEDSDLTYNNLQQFNVFGYYTTPGNGGVAVSVFDDTPVYRQDDTTWSYIDAEKGIDPRYWIPGAHYYFYAYSCGSVVKLNKNYGRFDMDLTDGKEPSERVLKIYDYLCDATHQHDLIYASSTGASASNMWVGITGKDNANPLVSFQFEHLLSKVKAQFTSKFPDGYSVEISDVTLQSVFNSGDYDPTVDGGWYNVAQNSNGVPFVYLLETANKKRPAITTATGGEAAVTDAAYVIPFAYDDTNGADVQPSNFVFLKFTIKVYNKGEEILLRELTGKFSPIWQKGYSYTYNVELSGSAANLDIIGFTTVVDSDGNVVSDWKNGNGVIKIQ